MGYADLLDLLLGVVVWSTAYVTVVVLASFRAFCTLRNLANLIDNMGYALLVICPIGSGKVILLFSSNCPF